MLSGRKSTPAMMALRRDTGEQRRGRLLIADVDEGTMPSTDAMTESPQSRNGKTRYKPAGLETNVVMPNAPTRTQPISDTA